MTAVKWGRELRAKKHDDTREINPCEQGYRRANRAIQQVVMKVRQQESEAEFRGFPQNAGQHGSRQRFGERYMSVWKKFVQYREQTDRHRDACENENCLPGHPRKRGQPRSLPEWNSFCGRSNARHERGEQREGGKQSPDTAHHREVHYAAAQERSRICSPHSVQRLLNYREHPRCGPQHHPQTAHDDAGRYRRYRIKIPPHKRMSPGEEREHLADNIFLNRLRSEDSIADSQQNQKCGKQCKHGKVRRRRRRGREVVIHERHETASDYPASVRLRRHRCSRVEAEESTAVNSRCSADQRQRSCLDLCGLGTVNCAQAGARGLALGSSPFRELWASALHPTILALAPFGSPCPASQHANTLLPQDACAPSAVLKSR